MMDKETVKDILRQLRGNGYNNKVISSFELYQVDDNDITLEVISEDIKDTFVIYPQELGKEEARLLGAKYNLNVRYSHSEDLVTGEEFKSITPLPIQQRYSASGDNTHQYVKEGYINADLPTVNNVVMIDQAASNVNSIYNHTMGLPFNLKLFQDRGYIYSKSIHDITRSDNCMDYVFFFFGPVSLEAEVSQGKVNIVKRL